MNAERRACVENGVVVVLAQCREARIASVLVAGIVVPVVPAPRPLTQVATERSHVANLRRPDLAGGHGEQRRLLLHYRALCDIGEERRGADAKPRGYGTDALELLHV